MKRFRVAVMLSLLVLSFATVAYSLSSHWSETYYYSDDTFTEEVGYKYVPCSGSIYHSGVVTNYWIQYGDWCPGSEGYCHQSYYDPVTGWGYVPC